MKYPFEKVLIGVLVLVHFSTSFAQNDRRLEKEIRQLHGQDEIQCYWEQILSLDQHYRDGNFKAFREHCTDERDRDGHDVRSIDCYNLKRTVIMIQHHGYPAEGEYPAYIHSAPAIIMVHQSSVALMGQFFPIYYQEWVAGRCSTSELVYILNNLYFLEFNKRLMLDENTDKENIDRYMVELNIDIEDIGYDTSIIDSECPG